MKLESRITVAVCLVPGIVQRLIFGSCFPIAFCVRTQSAVFDAASAAEAGCGTGAGGAPVGAGGGVNSSPDHSVNGTGASAVGGSSLGHNRLSGGARRSTIAPSASFRGLLSLFDSVRSPRGDESGGFFSGGGGAGGGGGGTGGGTSSRRWGGGTGKTRKKRGGSMGRVRRRGGGGGGAIAGGFNSSPPSGTGSSWHGGVRTRHSGGGGGSGSLVEFGGSPLRRHSLADPIGSHFSSSFACDGGFECGGAGMGAAWMSDFSGDFSGRGNALCRARSRWVL